MTDANSENGEGPTSPHGPVDNAASEASPQTIATSKIADDSPGNTSELSETTRSDTLNDKEWERRWRKREVFGLWAAAIVGGCAMMQSCQDSSEQRHELEEQRLTTIAQNRARLELRDGDLNVDIQQLPGVPGAPSSAPRQSYITVDALYRNVGASAAQYVVQTWAAVTVPIASAQETPTAPSCPTQEFAKNPSATQTIDPGESLKLYVEPVSLDDNVFSDAAKGVNKAVIVFGSVAYKDVFPDTEVHHVTWCVAVIPGFSPELYTRKNIFKNSD